MAWFAELNRRRWYCIIEMDAIREFKKKRYDEWWQSLTPEERERVLDQKERERQKNRDEARAAMQEMLMMEALIFNAYCRRH